VRKSKTLREIKEIKVYYVPDDDLTCRRQEEIVEILYQMMLPVYLESKPSNRNKRKKRV